MDSSARDNASNNLILAPRIQKMWRAYVPRGIPHVRPDFLQAPSDRLLTNKIDSFVSQCNQKCKAFTWTATADSIREKPARLCGRIADT